MRMSIAYYDIGIPQKEFNLLYGAVMRGIRA